MVTRVLKVIARLEVRFKIRKIQFDCNLRIYYSISIGAMDGRCGICGDPWDKDPRPHESPGGVFANGIIARVYRPGEEVEVEVDVTANHFGFFTFKLCPNNNTASDPKQDCFDRFLKVLISLYLIY